MTSVIFSPFLSRFGSQIGLWISVLIVYVLRYGFEKNAINKVMKQILDSSAQFGHTVLSKSNKIGDPKNEAGVSLLTKTTRCKGVPLLWSAEGTGDGVWTVV